MNKLIEKVQRRIRRFLGPAYERPDAYQVFDLDASMRYHGEAGQIRLNIGCGTDYRDGWKNIDISSAVKADAYYDIRDGIRENDGFCAEIYCSGVLEQILENEQFVHVMNELWRVLDPRGFVTIIVPSARYPFSFRDPFDCRHFIEETWDYLRFDSRLYKRYGQVYGFRPWILLKRQTNARGIMTILLRPHV